jgi:hypothetical protein
MLKTKRNRILLFIFALLIILFCGLAQATSYLTLTLYKIPFLLNLLGHGGIFLIFIAGIISFSYYRIYPAKFFQILTWILALEFIICLLNTVAFALQFGLAGLTIGLSLLILGVIDPQNIINQHI